MRQWYEEEPFTKGTIGEVDFIEKEIGFDKNAGILDIGCGIGRWSRERKLTTEDFEMLVVAKKS